MCEYCSLNPCFWEEVVRLGKGIKIVHVCTDKCTHGPDDFPHDYNPDGQLATGE